MSQLNGKGLHLVTGEKGGVGKSLFSMVLLEYCRAKAIGYRFFDADRTSPDVGAVYGELHCPGAELPSDDVPSTGDPNYVSESVADRRAAVEIPTEEGKPVYFSEEIEERFLADRLVEYAERELVIVNLPAQVETSVKRWYDTTDLAGSIAEGSLSVRFWFVTDGTPESLGLLERALTDYGDTLDFTIVVNEGLRSRAMENFKGHVTYEWALHRGASIVSLPELPLANDQKKALKASGLALKEAGETEAPGVTGLTRRRIRKFLADTTVALGTLGVLDPESSTKKNGSRKTKPSNGSGKAKSTKVPPEVGSVSGETGEVNGEAVAPGAPLTSGTNAGETSGVNGEAIPDSSVNGSSNGKPKSGRVNRGKASDDGKPDGSADKGTVPDLGILGEAG